MRYQDQGEIRDALRRLGSSESEALLYKGTVSVEGLHDTEMLQAGFDDLFRRYRLKQRGGRGQIELDIQELQKAEARGDEIGNHYFVFDFDRKPTALRETAHVRLLQLNRYCLENFVLDVDILTDLSRKSEFSDSPKANPTEMRDAMKAIAMTQLDEFVAREVFRDMGLEAIGFSMDVMRCSNSVEIASNLYSQIQVMMETFQKFAHEGFEDRFSALFSQKRKEQEAVWEEKWREKCNGKQLLETLRNQGHFKGDLLKLKKAAMSQMKLSKTEAYNSLHDLLRNLIAEPERRS